MPLKSLFSKDKDKEKEKEKEKEREKESKQQQHTKSDAQASSDRAERASSDQGEHMCMTSCMPLKSTILIFGIYYICFARCSHFSCGGLLIPLLKRSLG